MLDVLMVLTSLPARSPSFDRFEVRLIGSLHDQWTRHDPRAISRCRRLNRTTFTLPSYESKVDRAVNRTSKCIRVKYFLANVCCEVIILRSWLPIRAPDVSMFCSNFLEDLFQLVRCLTRYQSLKEIVRLLWKNLLDAIVVTKLRIQASYSMICYSL